MINMESTHYRTTQRRLTVAGAVLALLTAGAWFLKGRLPPPDEILPLLRQDPVQSATSRPPFTFAYAGKTYRVTPVAEYELWGLVVAHNDISALSDIYHTSVSVDTKDLGVIWGDNLANDNYRRVEFRSGSWTLYLSCPPGLALRFDQIANNHLITSDDEIRRQIGTVRVGDQIHLRGLLVNYQLPGARGFVRKTSTSRSDRGCEVVFVTALDILVPGTPGWYLLFSAGWIGLGAAILGKVALLWLDIRQETARLIAGRDGADPGLTG